MKSIRFRKEKISIKNIGHQRFWIGTGAGLITAITVSLAFNYLRKGFRFLTILSADLLILEENELRFFNIFFSVLSSVLGLSVSIWIWMSNRTHKRKKDRMYKQLATTNALLVFWVILMVIARFGSVLPIILYGLPGYDNHLNLYEAYWILFVLIPIVVFAQSWFSVRLVYRAGKWIFYSFLVCIFTAFILQLTTTVNQEKINISYHKNFEKDYQYIDDEIKRAKTEYGIEFDTQAIETLKKWHTEASIEQVMRFKAAFANNKQVSLDTIILEKIVIRNFKKGGWYYHQTDPIGNWHYALPYDVLAQLERFGVNSNQTKELFEVLREQIDLVNTQKIDREEYGNYTQTERRRSLEARYLIPESLILQLKEVRDSLIKDKKYYDFAKELPEIKNERY